MIVYLSLLLWCSQILFCHSILHILLPWCPTCPFWHDSLYIRFAMIFYTSFMPWYSMIIVTHLFLCHNILHITLPCYSTDPFDNDLLYSNYSVYVFTHCLSHDTLHCDNCEHGGHYLHCLPIRGCNLSVMVLGLVCQARLWVWSFV